MTFQQWFFGGIDNPRVENQWGALHITTMVISIALMLAFYFITKYSKNRDKTRKIIVITLASLILFFEITSRIMYIGKKYVLFQPGTEDLSLIWIILPKPWCAISCWVLMASVVINKKFFYNYASLSALLCSVIFFSYPGVGFNNEHIIFDNIYSIVTHALLLTMSVTLITLRFTEFRYKDFWKLAICFIATFAYGIIEIYVLKIQSDPMYFMPGGDIQAGILKISYGLYLFLYIFLFIVYVNAFHLIQDRKNVKQFFAKHFKKKQK
ncbi:MAG: YwaF family protein [Clostridia bacterium]|nr:YwaF family protein [Clostridia bacterium]